MSIWCSLFVPTDDRDPVIAAAQRVVSDAGYRAYDPFSGIPGPAYAVTVKAFIAPFDAGWVRILFERAPDLLPDLLAALPGAIVLDGAAPDLDGSPSDAPAIRGITLDSLPAAAQQLSGTVDLAAANSMADRMIGALSGKLGMSADDAAGARAMISAGSAAGLDLGSAVGRALAARAGAAGLPLTWHTPDYLTLRDAYAVHRRVQRFPNAKLMPDEIAARAAVPDALNYLPLFAGKAA